MVPESRVFIFVALSFFFCSLSARPTDERRNEVRYTHTHTRKIQTPKQTLPHTHTHTHTHTHAFVVAGGAAALPFVRCGKV